MGAFGTIFLYCICVGVLPVQWSRSVGLADGLYVQIGMRVRDVFHFNEFVRPFFLHRFR